MAIKLGDGVLRLTGDSSELQRNLRQFAQQAGRFMAIAGAAITAAFASTVSAAADFESAFAGVKKTIETTEQGYARLSEEMIAMSEIVPISAANIARIAELGGQLGISQQNVVGFARTIADLRVSTDLAGDASVLLFAQLANIARVDEKDFGRLGSAIVELGNNSRTTESMILNMAKRIAAAGTNAGLTIEEILALATSFSSVGLEAELGGNSIGRIINDIRRFVATGDIDKLKLLAEITGLSISGFTSLFDNDAIRGLEAFFKGIARLEEGAGSAIPIIDELGFGTLRLLDVIQRGGLAQEDLTRFIGLANRAYKDNIALTIEAEKRYETFDSQVGLLKNSITNLRIAIGDPLKERLKELIQDVRPFIQSATEWVKNNEEIATTMSLVVTGIGALLIVLGSLALLIPIISSGLGILLSPIIAIGAALIGLNVLLLETIARLLGFESARDFLTKLFDLFKTIYEGIKEETAQLWESLKVLFETGLNILFDILEIFFGPIAEFWREQWKILVSETEDGTNGIIEKLETFLVNLNDKVRQMDDKLRNWRQSWIAFKIGFLLILKNIEDGFNSFMLFIDLSILGLEIFIQRIRDLIADFKQLAIDVASFGLGGGFIGGLITGGGESSVPNNQPQIGGGGTTAVKSIGGNNLTVDLRGAIIKEEMDVDNIIQEMTNAWNTNIQQNGGSTASIG